ncbi:MAG: aldo/keto reductase [Myxococcales bacterium]|nr:aldo/keto reductase [Myxococcales bacterium]
MDYPLIGGTGMRTSALAFGTMTFGGEADREASAALYRACRDAGVIHFDTANIYTKGASERILGELVQGHRHEVVLATKAYFPVGVGVNDRGASRRHLRQSVEASLSRLQTDRVDLFYIHKFDDHTDLAQVLRTLEDLVRQGLVLHPAVSNFAAWQVTKALGLQALHDLSPIVAIQPMYNALKRQAEVELLPMAQSEGLAVFPYSPLAGGLLTGKSASGDDRLARNEMYKTRYAAHLEQDRGAAFSAIAQGAGLHPVTLAVAWAAQHPAVTAPLLGARSVAQLEPALAAAEVSLDPEVVAQVNALVPAPAPATDRTEETVGHGIDQRR